MRALSVRPPWAWAIAHADKRIENRSWRTSYRGPLAIHASQKFVGSEAAELERILGYELDPTMFKRGAFIAVADLVDVVKAEAIKPSPWLCGPYAWLLEDVRPLSAEVPRKRQVGTVATNSSSLGPSLEESMSHQAQYFDALAHAKRRSRRNPTLKMAETVLADTKVDFSSRASAAGILVMP